MAHLKEFEFVCTACHKSFSMSLPEKTRLATFDECDQKDVAKRLRNARIVNSPTPYTIALKDTRIKQCLDGKDVKIILSQM